MWVVTDQPGRLLALTVVTPSMLHASRRLHDPACSAASRLRIARVLGTFAVVFFAYELFWITARPPKEARL